MSRIASGQTAANLREIARMAYGSGPLEGERGGAGRMGIWTVGGAPRIIKFNTHLSERLTGPGVKADGRMMQSSNLLRHELLHIAEAANLDEKDMARVRKRLDMSGTEPPRKLLDRTDVAAVVTMIGGKKVWRDALAEKGDRGMDGYASKGRDTSFGALVSREEAPEQGKFADDREQIVRDCLHALGGGGDVFDDETIAACVRAMKSEAASFGRIEVKKRLRSCLAFIAAARGPGGDAAGSRIEDIRSACVRQMASGAMDRLEDRLARMDVTLADCIANGGAVFFANPSAQALLEEALDGLEAKAPSDVRERALRLCKNISWALETGLACCHDVPDRQQTLAELAGTIRGNAALLDRLKTSDEIDLRASVRGGDASGENTLERVALLAHGAESLRAARQEARSLVERRDLQGLLRDDDPLLSPRGDPFSTPNDVFRGLEGNPVSEASLSRPLFVRYRLAMLKVVADALEKGTLDRGRLAGGNLDILLSGQVPAGFPNAAALKSELAKAGLEVLSTSPTFSTGSLVPQDDFAAEALGVIRPILPSKADQLKSEMKAWLGKAVEDAGPIMEEADLVGLFEKCRTTFNDLAAYLGKLAGGAEKPSDDVLLNLARAILENGVDRIVKDDDLAKSGSKSKFLDRISPWLNDRKFTAYGLKKGKKLSNEDEKRLRAAGNGIDEALQHISQGFITYDEKAPGSPTAAEQKMFELVRTNVLRTLSGDRQRRADLDGKIKAAKDAANAFRMAEKPSERDLQAVLDAFGDLAQFLDGLARPAHEAAFNAVKGMVGADDLRLARVFDDANVLNPANTFVRLGRLGLTVQQAKEMTDEQLGLWSRVYKANLTSDYLYFGPFLREVKDGRIPPRVLTQEVLGLVAALLTLKGASKRRDASDLDGLGTLSGEQIVRILVANGIDTLVNGKAAPSDMWTMARAITLLNYVNGSPMGLSEASLRVFGKPIDQVKDADIKAKLKLIRDPDDPGNPLAGVDRLRALKGVPGEIASYFRSDGSVASLSFARGDKAKEDLLGLRAALKAVYESGEPREVTVGGVPLRLSRDAGGRLVFTVEGLTAVGAQSIVRMIDDITQTIVSDVATYGAETVSNLLPPDGTGADDVTARDTCLAFLSGATGLPVTRFASVGTADLVRLAHEALDKAGSPDDRLKLVSQRLGELRDDAGLCSKETQELCRRMEAAEPADVRKKVILPGDGDGARSPSLRDFAADLFQREDLWRDDGDSQGTARLKDLLKENASLVRDLMQHPERYDELKVGFGPEGWEGRDALVRTLRTAVDGIRSLAGVPAGTVPDENAIRAALEQPGAARVLQAAAEGIAAAGAAFVAAAQETMTNVFVAALKKTQVEVQDPNLQPLRLLAGVGSFDVTQGFGKFLALALEKYFSGMDGKDRSSILRSLMSNTGPDATPVQVLSALVKGAGPIMQKLIQGIPPSALPAELRPVVDCSKSTLAPIPRGIVRAKLLDMVERSGGTIESIEVKKSLGAASVGEALLCVVRTKGDPYGEECVIKMLRPDVQSRARREQEFLRSVARDVPGVPEMFEGRCKVIEQELDLTVEARNIELGRIYGPKGNGAGKDGVDSVSLHPLISPSTGAVALRKAPGVTFDRCLDETDRRLEAIVGKFRREVTDKRTGKSHFELSSASVPEVLAAKVELQKLYAEMLARHEKLIAFARKWTKEAIFEGGVYHGDLHAGNMMIDDGQLTVIDYGNAFKLSDKDRNNLMGVVMASAIGSASSFIDKVCEMVRPEDREAFAKGMKALEGELAVILKKGAMTEIPLRLMSAMRLMEKSGLQIPPALFNFSQSMTRLFATIDAVEDSLARIRALSEDLVCDDSEYGKETSLGNGKGLKEVSNNPYRIRKDMPIDLTGRFPDLLRKLPVQRTARQVADKTYPDPSGSGESLGRKEFDEAVWRGYAPPSRTYFSDPEIEKWALGMLSSPEKYKAFKAGLAKIFQLADGELKTVDDGKVGMQINGADDNYIAPFESLPEPGRWTNEAAKKELWSGIKHILDFAYRNITLNFAKTLYPDFGTPQNYGDVLFNLVSDHLKAVKDRAGGKLFGEAIGFGLMSASTAFAVLEDIEAANGKADEWLAAHPGFSHYDAAKLKSVANDLLLFNDKTFVQDGLWFAAKNWSANKDKRTNFLKGMDLNLKTIDGRLRQLGLVGGDEGLLALRKELLLTYYMTRTGVMTAFANDPNASKANRMTRADFRQLLDEARQLSGGPKPQAEKVPAGKGEALSEDPKDEAADLVEAPDDTPLVKTLKFFRRKSLKLEK